MNYSFPLRSLDAPSVAPSAFLLRRYYGDDANMLVRRWCDDRFMAGDESPWPLVLYGPAGTGKTALAETLVCRLNSPCLQLTADEFRRRFLAAVATRSLATFRNKIQNHEVLLLDHLSLPSDEISLVRELVQLVDYYRGKSRPVIVTTQQNPCLMESTFGPLRSRLSEGLVIEIKRPGPAARREIAAEIIQHFGLKILDEDLDWLTKSLPETAPLIRNYLSRIALESCDTLLTRDMLKTNAGNRITMDPKVVRQLVLYVGRQFGQRVSDITGKSRRKEVVRARSVAMYLSRELLGTTFRETGKLIGNRDPSTVRHAHRQVIERISCDPGLAESIKRITHRFVSNTDRQRGQLVN